MDKIYFELTQEHIMLLRSAYVSWEDCEFGAPSIDCKRPYGNSDVYQDMMKILGLEGNVEEFYNKLGKLHIETEIALQIILYTGSFILGNYEADEYNINWKKI